MEKRIKIRKGKKIEIPELSWEKGERDKLVSRIQDLSDTHIGALAMILVSFDERDIPDIVSEIREHGADALHMETILSEAESKEKVRWWIDYFQKDR